MRLLILALLLLPLAATGDCSLPGRVIRIVDGNAIVLKVQDARHRVRLAGIDAPERNQPWGDTATRELRRQIASKHVVVDWYNKDRWKRLIDTVRLSGEDMGLHLIDRGLAWHYYRYEQEQSPGPSRLCGS